MVIAPERSLVWQTHAVYVAPVWSNCYFWGGIPIERHKSKGMVEQAIEAFDRHEPFILALSPKGIRGLTTSWKMGFYYIATGAGLAGCAGFQGEEPGYREPAMV